MTINKIRSQARTLSSAGSPMYQNVTIGSQTTDGRDAVNDLTSGRRFVEGCGC